MLDTLDHLVVAVRDLDAATSTYESILGRTRSWRGNHPHLGTANALFRLDNTYLELISPEGEGAFADRLRARLDEQGEGLAMLAFGTADAEACAKTLRERGLPASDPQPGEGRDQKSGAERHWRGVFLPPSSTRGLMVFAVEHLDPPEALPESVPIGDDADAGSAAGPHAGVVYGADHVVIRSADPEATRRFWGEQFGLRLALDRSFEQRGVRLLFFRVGGVTVEIAARLGVEVRSDEPDRLWGVAWQVADVDAARTRVERAGLTTTEARDGHKPGTRVCTISGGTCGVPTLLIQPAPPRLT